MAVSPDEVRKVADLARLELTAEEAERMSRELSAVLDYFARLDRIAAEGTEEDGDGGKTPLREDRVEPWPDSGEALREAPDAKDGLFRVPPAIGG